MMKEIKLSQGLFALVDDDDYEELNQYKWYADKGCNTYYVVRNDYSNGQHKRIKIHRAIMGTPKGLCTDHKNGNGLDNRKENLRIVSTRQNCQNKHIKKSSQYVGVYWYKSQNRWVARIEINKKRKIIGGFKNELDAYNAYLKKLQEIGERIL